MQVEFLLQEQVWVVHAEAEDISTQIVATTLAEAKIPCVSVSLVDALAGLYRGLRPGLLVVEAEYAEHFQEIVAATSEMNPTSLFYIIDGTTRSRQLAFATGASDYLARPIQPAEVISRVTQRLDMQALRKSLRLKDFQFTTMLDNIGQGVCLFDADRRLVLSNGKYAEVYGVHPEAVRPGMTLDEVAELRYDVGSGPAVPREEYLDFCERVNSSSLPQEWTAELRSGKVVRVHHKRTSDGGWVSTHEDITERRDAEQRIAHLTTHDPLTDLPNRLALTERLVSLVNEHKNHAGRFAVLALDMDRFKNLNETFGHRAGDAVLCAVAQRLRALSKPCFAARTGGDEFVLLIDTDVDSVADFADEMLRTLSDEIATEGQPVRMGVSVGISLFPEDATDPSVLLRNAEFALQLAKTEARGSARFFTSETHRLLRERRALQNELREAVSARQLSIFYQPLASISGEAVGFEALMRWNHPVRGFIAPSTFIPIAEESGLIVEVGEWILRESCKEAASWASDLQVAVNLSPIQFRRGDLVSVVQSALSDSGLRADRLELEITEGVLIDDLNAALSTLKQLKALGVRIAMDDFGTGYSSLSYLRSFPFDKIKIDQSFVKDVDRAQSAEIVRAVIGLGRGLKLPVVAEGVETMGQLSFLQRENCDQIQGFLIGKPLPISEYAAFVARSEAPQFLV